MAVQVWIGEKPEHPNERRAIVALANGLERLDGLYLILANFSVGGRNVDMVIIKSDAIFIVELKHCDGKVFGDVNGPWFAESANGERKRLNPGRKNPYNQVISYYYSLINFLNEHRGEFLSPQKASSVDFRTCRRVVVIAPSIQEGSRVETDWKVELKGLDELPTYLVTERSSEIDLTDEEMLAIPRLLHCTRWNEINALLAGVLPQWDAPTPQPEPAPIEPQPAPELPPAPEPAPPLALAPTPNVPSPTRHFLSTRAGRVAVALGALALVLALALLLRSRPTPAIGQIDQPSEVVTASTGLPAGGQGAGAVVGPTSCVWSGFQPVGRRRGPQPDLWENVGVSGAAPALAPDVVVTLEEVRFCGEQIAITWSLRNNMDDETVTLPLDRENIVVRDSLGNEYAIDPQKSRPAVIRATPQRQAQGSAVIARPVNGNALTLVIKLKQLPFGEATWFVPIGDTGR